MKVSGRKEKSQGNDQTREKGKCLNNVAACAMFVGAWKADVGL